MQCITYVADELMRLSPGDSGYYNNVYPWIAWQKGKRIPNDNVKDGIHSRRRTPKQLTLSQLHKPAGNVAKIKFDRLIKHDIRADLLRELNLNVKLCSEPQY